MDKLCGIMATWNRCLLETHKKLWFIMIMIFEIIYISESNVLSVFICICC